MGWFFSFILLEVDKNIAWDFAVLNFLEKFSDFFSQCCWVVETASSVDHMDIKVTGRAPDFLGFYS